MKKVTAGCLVILMLLSTYGCTSKGAVAKLYEEGTGQNTGKPSEHGNALAEEPDNNKKVLKTLDCDLDGDGKEEKIQLVEELEERGSGRLKGQLLISNEEAEKKIVYRDWGNQLTGTFQAMDIEDLDDDGIKDIFIVIPDVSSEGTANYFFAYNFKTGEEIRFDFDYSNRVLRDFISSFKYRYLSKDRLELINEMVEFKGTLNLDNIPGMPVPQDGEFYHNTSSPVPVALKKEDNADDEQEGRFISSIRLAKGKDEKYEIVVPLILSAFHYSNIIGEVDVFMEIDREFNLVAKRFEVYSLSFQGEVQKHKFGEGIF